MGGISCGHRGARSFSNVFGIEKMRLVGIWDYNVTQGILQWDKEMCQIFGYEGDDFKVGGVEMFSKMVHEEDMPGVMKKVQSCIEGGERYDVVYRAVKPNGSIARVHAWGSVFTHNGDVCLIGACDEITVKHELYEELIKMK